MRTSVQQCNLTSMLARVILSQGLKPDIDTFDVPVSVGYTFN